MFFQGTSDTVGQLMKSLPRSTLDKDDVYQKLLNSAKHKTSPIDKTIPPSNDTDSLDYNMEQFWTEYLKPLLHVKNQNCSGSDDVPDECWLCHTR